MISTFVQKLAAWISKNAIEISRANEDGVSGQRISHSFVENIDLIAFHCNSSDANALASVYSVF